MERNQSTRMLSEMKLFASFSAAEQRFIRRSLDVALHGDDATSRWARNRDETCRIEGQARRYRALAPIRACIPEDPDPSDAEPILAPLISIVTCDLVEGRLTQFESFFFLYERLLGPRARPWLVSVFCAAAALPGIQPEARKQLLQSVPIVDVVAPGWSIFDPLFFPQWVEKVEEVVN